MSALLLYFLPQKENDKKTNHRGVFGYRYHSIVAFELTECRCSKRKGE